MSEFLLELRSEEIPARMQAGARADLEKLFRKEMAAAGVTVGEMTVWSTPRRLALIARGLPTATAAVSEELKGPRVGAPPQALEGFLRKTGLSEDQLTERDGVLYAVTEKPGRQLEELLAIHLPLIVARFPWPKSMRWGNASVSTESIKWVRPLSGIIAILDNKPLAISFDMANVYADGLGNIDVRRSESGLVSSNTTFGHRFHSSGPIQIDGADDYAAKLRAAHVIVDHEERQDFIREHAVAAAHAAGLVMVADEGLVIENAGLTEWPVPLLGRFDEAFLDVPPEVIQLTARTNQKYFICCTPAKAGASSFDEQPPEIPASAGTRLANAFICTANIVAIDGGAAIVDGNRKVLAARLADARFFWEQDRKKTLSEHADGLARITFHEKLGTVADKVERVAKLARWLVEEGIVGSRSPAQAGASGDSSRSPAQAGASGGSSRSLAQAGASGGSSRSFAQAGASGLNSQPPEVPSFAGTQKDLADQAELAARLCKADLVTEMVGEFPELQGVIGGYYAADEGLPQAVADAIRDHYKPVGQGDDVPTAPVTVAVSLADKLDTIAGFFLIGEKPTGSKDPFALRRAGIGIGRSVLSNQLRFALIPAILKAMFGVLDHIYKDEFKARRQLLAPALIELSANQPLLTAAVEQLYPQVDAPGANDVVAVTQRDRDSAVTLLDLFGFLIDRLKVQQREAGVRHDLIDAVFALGGEDDLVRLLARVHALQAFIGTEDGTNLLAGYKRAANILKKEGYTNPADRRPGLDPGSRLSAGGAEDSGAPGQARGDTLGGEAISLSYTPEPAEKALMDALSTAGPQAAAAVQAEDFAGAMAALATLRAPIDAFFDSVTVNDPETDKRTARLSLLAQFRDAVHSVADFSKIEG